VTPEEKALVLEAARILNNLAGAAPQQVGPYAQPEPYRAVQPGTVPYPSVVPDTRGTVPYSPWACPVHGTAAKLVPAGISRSSGRAYNAFMACSTPFCSEPPPRNGPVGPVEPRRATNYPEVVHEPTRGLTELP
jgi:hypothetical protein